MRKLFYFALLFCASLAAQSCNNNTDKTENNGAATNQNGPAVEAGDTDDTEVTGVGGTAIENKGHDTAIDTGTSMEVPMQKPESGTGTSGGSR